jgi:hypothetical protein
MNENKSRFGALVMIALVATTLSATPILLQLRSANAFTVHAPLVQVAASGSNVYVVWDSNKTSTLKEILFRASSDNGKTFSDKINLSHSPQGFSELARLLAENVRHEIL